VPSHGTGLRSGSKFPSALGERIFVLGTVAGRSGDSLGADRCLQTKRQKSQVSSVMASRARQGWAFLVAVLFLVGCTGPSRSVNVTQKSSGETVYETQEMRLKDIQMTSGLRQQNRYYVQVSGTCTGTDCVPSTYSLSFIKEGPQEVTIVGGEVTLSIGSETLRWEDPQSRETTRRATIRSGVFARVDVSSKQLSTFGASREVSGTVGGEGFRLPYRSRSPVRALLSRLEKVSSASSDEGSTGKSR
jgi:hypothetical protein